MYYDVVAVAFNHTTTTTVQAGTILGPGWLVENRPRIVVVTEVREEEEKKEEK